MGNRRSTHKKCLIGIVGRMAHRAASAVACMGELNRPMGIRGKPRSHKAVRWLPRCLRKATGPRSDEEVPRSGGRYDFRHGRLDARRWRNPSSHFRPRAQRGCRSCRAATGRSEPAPRATGQGAPSSNPAGEPVGRRITPTSPSIGGRPETRQASGPPGPRAEVTNPSTALDKLRIPPRNRVRPRWGETERYDASGVHARSRLARSGFFGSTRPAARDQ